MCYMQCSEQPSSIYMIHDTVCAMQRSEELKRQEALIRQQLCQSLELGKEAYGFGEYGRCLLKGLLMPQHMLPPLFVRAV